MHVLIADDHPLVADALNEYLKSIDPDLEVTRSESLQGASENAEKSGGFDLIILDLNMPGMNGLEGLTLIRNRFPDIPVVIISGAARRRDILDAFDRGAAGFIPKDLSGRTIIKALELVLAGEKYVPSSLVAKGGFGMGAAGYGEQGMWEPDSPLNKLTARERQALALLLEGCSNKEIADRLGLKVITAAFHLQGVFKKLGVSNRTQAATTAIRLGWNSVEHSHSK